MVNSCWILVCFFEDKQWNWENTDVSLLGWPISLGILSLEWGEFSYTNLVEYGFECELCIEKSGVYSKEPQQSEASWHRSPTAIGEGQSWRWCTEQRAEKAGKLRGGLATEIIRTPKNLSLCIHLSSIYVSIYLSIYIKMVHQIRCPNLVVLSCRPLFEEGPTLEARKRCILWIDSGSFLFGSPVGWWIMGSYYPVIYPIDISSGIPMRIPDGIPMESWDDFRSFRKQCSFSGRLPSWGEADAEMGDGGCTWARAITASWRAVFWRNDMRIQRLYIDLTYIWYHQLSSALSYKMVDAHPSNCNCNMYPPWIQSLA